MIQGVKIKKLVVHQDVPDTPSSSPSKLGGESGNRTGFLMEVLRNNEGLLKKFGQTTFTVAYAGTIKAFHWHKKQDDLWFVATGKAMIVLYDLRKKSSTRGKTDVIIAGEGDYKLIVIPKGVVHGYKVLSKKPVLLFYHTTECYQTENPDEERIPFDDPKIGFDWNRNYE